MQLAERRLNKKEQVVCCSLNQSQIIKVNLHRKWLTYNENEWKIRTNCRGKAWKTTINGNNNGIDLAVAVLEQQSEQNDNREVRREITPNG